MMIACGSERSLHHRRCSLVDRDLVRERHQHEGSQDENEEVRMAIKTPPD